MTHDPSDRQAKAESNAIPFGVRLAESDAFKALFRTGMALVEETAAYLDGDGRASSRGLSRVGSLAYATESMRLTTRLMQLASWLLLQRALQDGELSRDQAEGEKRKVRLDQPSASQDGPGLDELPPRLKDLIGQSIALQGRVRRFAAILAGSPGEGAVPNPVEQEFQRLSAALGLTRQR